MYKQVYYLLFNFYIVFLIYVNNAIILWISIYVDAVMINLSVIYIIHGGCYGKLKFFK